MLLNVLKNHKNHRELHLMAATAAGCPKRCPKNGRDKTAMGTTAARHHTD